MANARLWWDGSAWQTTDTYWLDHNSTAALNFGVLSRIKLIAYDDCTLKLEASIYPANSGGIITSNSYALQTSSGRNIEADGVTILTLLNNNREPAAVNVTGNTIFSYSGNVSVYRMASGVTYGNASNISGSTTITDPFATISYNANGGSDAPAAKTVLKGVATTISGTVPTWANHTFLGWSTDPAATAATYYSGDPITVTGDTVLYAVWKVNSYTLTVNKPWTATVTILKNGTAYSGATVDYGDILTVTFTPAAGYFIDSATLNGSAVSSGDTHTVTGNVTITVTTVAQYSTIASFDSVVETLGTFHLTVNQYDPSHWCKVRYYDSNSTLLDTSSAFTTSTTEAIPQSWFNSFASVAALTITAELTTYTDSSCTTQTGSTDSITFTVNADSSMKPTLAAGCISLAPDNTGTGAINLQDQLFIKGYSKVAATFDTTKITHANGASAAAYAITVLSVKTSSASSTLTSSNVLTVADDITVTYSVTDTRGRSASGTETISVNDYIGPTLQPLICKRTDSGGTEDDSGTYMTIKATANYAPLSDNAPTLTLYAKPAGGAYTSYGTITDGATTLFGGGTFSPDASYVVKVTVTDKLGNGSYLEISMPKRSWDFHIGRVNGSTGAAFGKVTEYANTLQLASGWGFRMGATTLSEAQLIKMIQLITEDPLNTFSGTIVQFIASKAKPIQSIVGTVTASQDLHGYDAPFAPGAKKNWFPYPFVDTTKTVTGITFTDLGDGQIRINGTNTGTTYATFELQASFSFGSTTTSFSASSKKYVYGDETLYMMGLASGIGAVYEGNTGRVYIRVTKGATINNVTVSPMMYKTVDNLTVFAPYANICPITGLTGANIFLEAAYDAGALPKRTVAFGQTVYGGDYTVAADGSVSIELTDAEIASYAGEALPSTWLSDRDEYAVGTTPTTGAQVVYKLASPTTVTATSITALTTLVGNNAVWADTGDITVTAYGT